MDNFSGVVHDVTLRIALTVWLVLRLDVDQIDIETAFLEGELKENKYVYIGGNQGSNTDGDQQIRYGTVTIGKELAIMKPKKFDPPDYNLSEIDKNEDGSYKTTH